MLLGRECDDPLFEDNATVECERQATVLVDLVDALQAGPVSLAPSPHPLTQIGHCEAPADRSSGTERERERG